MNSSTNRTSSDTNPPANYGEGVDLIGTGSKMINMVIHDTAQGMLTTANPTPGLRQPHLLQRMERLGPRPWPRHLPATRRTTLKPVYDNIIFEQLGYGIHGYTTNGGLDYLDVEGNTSFDNGGISEYGWTTNILIGGLQVATSPLISANFTYNQVHGGMNNLGYNAGCTNPTLTNNYLDGGTALTVINCTGLSMTGNTFYGAISGFTQSQFPNNTYYSSRPTGVKTSCAPTPSKPAAPTSPFSTGIRTRPSVWTSARS